jgi:hypothetical protein
MDPPLQLKPKRGVSISSETEKKPFYCKLNGKHVSLLQTKPKKVSLNESEKKLLHIMGERYRRLPLPAKVQKAPAL